MQSNANTDEKLRVQLNSFDFYETEPSQLIDTFGSGEYKYEQVPILRIYGSLPTGHNVMMHIHGVFPYMLVQYNEVNISNIAENCKILHTKLEQLLRDYYSKAKNKKKKNVTNLSDENDLSGAKVDGNEHVECVMNKKTKSSSNAKTFKYIAKVEVVKGVPFYCYHVGWTLFYKISLLQPNTMNRISDILRSSGDIFHPASEDPKAKSKNKPKIKVYEAHIPFFSQFCLDYNIYGCSWIRLKECYFRSPIFNNDYNLEQLWGSVELSEYISSEKTKDSLLDSNKFPRMSNNLLEVDVLAQFIMNREDLKPQDIHSAIKEVGLGYSQNFKESVSSTNELWSTMEKHRAHLNLPPYMPSNLSNINVKQTPWSDLDSLSTHFDRLYSENTKNGDFQTPSFLLDSKYFDVIGTLFEAASSLWPKIPVSLEQLGSESNTVAAVSPKPCSPKKVSSARDELLRLEDSPFDVDDFVDNTMDKKIKVGKTSPISAKYLNDFQLTQQNMSLKRSSLLNQYDETTQVGTQKLRKFPKKSGISASFNHHSSQVHEYKPFSFCFNDINRSFDILGIPKIDYQSPFISNPKDYQPNRKYEYAGNVFSVDCHNVKHKKAVSFKDYKSKFQPIATQSKSVFVYVPEAPTYLQVLNSGNVEDSDDKTSAQSQIDITNNNKVNYKYASYDKSKSQTKGNSEYNHLTQLSIELFVSTRKDLFPDPLKDAINLLFWNYQNKNIELDYVSCGVLCYIGDVPQRPKLYALCSTLNINIVFFTSERDLLDGIVEIVQTLDPDILSGFEIHSSSWGYLVERSSKFHEYDICKDLSRVNFKAINKVGDQWGYTHASAIRIVGRHMLNIWRILRGDLNLLKYNVENIVYHVLHKRIPHFSHESLSSMWHSGSFEVVLNYWNSRLEHNIELLDKLEILPKITEQARLVGIDFYSVIYRGSQFKIESIMARITRAEHYIMLSPTRKEVRSQKPIESISLVIEPPSGFYKSPMVVLDFQSLYPSIMIAYNYCFSTILGDVRLLKSSSRNKVGVNDQYILHNDLLNCIGKENITIAPNGIMFVKETVRKSVLSKMLSNILDSRIMVKSLMTLLKDSLSGASLIRDLNSMQLALKLILNVTYGYTAASFSGRMPCQELADSIVETGRETLLKAITLIEANNKWGAKVVYGDTDSLFVYFPGKSTQEAFKYGREMAQAVTNSNPAPVKLKFEKVYFPCLLMAKKRYVGNMYEFEDQSIPKLDAKGIEIIRRDGNPAQQKLVEQSIRILFASKDFSRVKSFVQTEFIKIVRGKILIQDFCFAKEVKLGHYKSEKTMPPGAVLAKKLMKHDHRTEPQYKERVPFVVVKGKSTDLLRDRCVPPLEFLKNMRGFRLDSEYYIMKTLIPPLNRIFNLMGINVLEWWNEIPKDQTFEQNSDTNIVSHLKANTCTSCGKFSMRTICDLCLTREELIQTKAHFISELKKMDSVMKVCRQCVSTNYCNNNNIVSSNYVNDCDSQDCPVYYQRQKLQFRLNSANPVTEVGEVLMTQEVNSDVSIVDIDTQYENLDW